jgi:hypothetical protein
MDSGEKIARVVATLEEQAVEALILTASELRARAGNRIAREFCLHVARQMTICAQDNNGN